MFEMHQKIVADTMGHMVAASLFMGVGAAVWASYWLHFFNPPPRRGFYFVC